MKVILLLALLSLSLCDDCTGSTNDVKDCLAKDAGEGKTCCLRSTVNDVSTSYQCFGYTADEIADLAKVQQNEQKDYPEGTTVTITCKADDKKSSGSDTKTTAEDDSSSSNYLTKSLIILLSLLF